MARITVFIISYSDALVARLLLATIPDIELNI